MKIVSTLRDWYARFERPISSISLIGGFVFDAFTLKRVDLFLENFWVIVHLVIVALCIIFINLGERGEIDEKDPARLHFWLINILQFFFGGLLSTFLVYYFRAGTLSVSWPFLLILLAAFIANESFKKHYSRLIFQISLLFLSIFSFAIFIVPVLVHTISPTIFFLSGVASLVAIYLFLLLLRFVSKEKFKGNRWALFGTIAGIFIAMNVLYYYNFIPPLPLSLKEGEIYHSLTVVSPGIYTVQSESQPFWSSLQFEEPVHIMPGDSLYAYSAVFSPASFSLQIIHQWQRYSTSTKNWIEVARVVLPVVGGRDGGYRTFSEVRPTTGGSWRVNVETSRGDVIGRLEFSLTIQTSTEPALVTSEIN